MMKTTTHLVCHILVVLFLLFGVVVVVDGFAAPQSRLPSTVASITQTRSAAKNKNAATGSLLTMTSVEGDFDPAYIANSRVAIANGSLRAKVNAIYKFTRPHTIRGTILASIAGTIRALLDTTTTVTTQSTAAASTSVSSISSTVSILQNLPWSTLLPRATIGMVALLLGNAFIVGINQIYDKDIDIVNKPFLPVASGEMTTAVAWIVVVASGIVGPMIVYNYFPKLLFQLYMTGWTLGFLYSVPPIRTKRNPLLAGLTIATVRGFLLNFGVYYAVKDAISPIMNNIATVGGGVASSSSAAAAFVWSPKVAFIARFMTTFASVIAVTKDLPDVDGDREYNISTFATRLGVSRIANVATGCLALNYIHAILTGVLHPVGTFNMIPMIGGHALLALLLGHHYGELQSDSLPSIKKYYKHIWDLFYLEYVLYTLI